MLSSLHLLWISSSLIVSFSVWIICVISLWLVTILPVSSSETLFVASETSFCCFWNCRRCCCVVSLFQPISTAWSSVSYGSLNMCACIPPSFEPNPILSLISSSSNWVNSYEDVNLLSDAKLASIVSFASRSQEKNMYLS